MPLFSLSSMLKTNSLCLHRLSSRLNILSQVLQVHLLFTLHANKNISSMNRFSMCSQISLLAKCGITCIADKFISSMDRIFEFYRLLWRKLTCTDYNCTDSPCDLRYTFRHVFYKFLPGWIWYHMYNLFYPIKVLRWVLHGLNQLEPVPKVAKCQQPGSDNQNQQITLFVYGSNYQDRWLALLLNHQPHLCLTDLHNQMLPA